MDTTINAPTKSEPKNQTQTRTNPTPWASDVRGQWEQGNATTNDDDRGKTRPDDKPAKLKTSENNDELEANRKAATILFTQGTEAAVKHMFTRDDGTQRSYAEMRSLYG